MRVWLLLPVIASLTGCATAPPMVWLRTDGKSIKEDGALTAQFEIDKTACIGEAQKANLSAGSNYMGGIAGGIEQARRNNAALDVAKGCMADRGYVNVLASEADGMRERFAETAQQRRKLAEADVKRK